jgi:hypothetical protein
MNTIKDITAEVLFEMFTENTGKHLLDSGGAYGRNWERNQGKTLEDFLDADYLTISWPNDETLPSGAIQIDAFGYLNERLTFDVAMNAAYQEFSKNSDASYLEDMELFCEEVLGLQPQETFYDEGYYTYNTYNHEYNLLSQTLQFTIANTGLKTFVILQVHGGCDIRGGYTAPKVFTVNDAGEFILDAEREYVRCYSEACEFEFYFGIEGDYMNGVKELKPINGAPICPNCNQELRLN